MSRALSSSEFNVVLFPTIYSFVPVLSRARKLVMMHDVIAETFPQLTVPRPTARLFWNAKVALGRMQADALVTVSDYSKQEILHRFGGDPEHIHVVGEAADPVFRRLERPCPGPNLKKLGLDGSRQMVLYLGGFSPHKNLEALVNAFARSGSDALLVMVGDISGDAFYTYYGTIAARVEQLGLNDRVVFTGFLSDEDLVVLLNIATVLVLPSLMEGFGLPAVEAAACGCPVIATKASPLPALLGEAGVFIGPSEDEIARTLDLVLASPEMQARMKERAVQAAARLTWEHAAQQMMAVIHGRAS
jgi:glycosyltransferase involved in cell wall biosynthesis